MNDKNRKAMFANRIRQLEKNVRLLEDERRIILQNNEFAVGSGYDNHNTLKKKLSSKSGNALDRLDEINHRLPYIRTEIENLENKEKQKGYGYQDTDRSELINRLRNREVGLSGGHMTRGTNFELKHFKNSDLKRMLESSRPLGSSIKTNRSAGTKQHFVLGDTYQKQNINTDFDKSYHKHKGLT